MSTARDGRCAGPLDPESLTHMAGARATNRYVHDCIVDGVVILCPFTTATLLHPYMHELHPPTGCPHVPCPTPASGSCPLLSAGAVRLNPTASRRPRTRRSLLPFTLRPTDPPTCAAPAPQGAVRLPAGGQGLPAGRRARRLGQRAAAVGLGRQQGQALGRAAGAVGSSSGVY